jgi:3-hydroxybutyryl-CoA dehydrogenase
MLTPLFQQIGIVGTGAMGRGIAQMVAQTGCTVLLYDSFDGAAATAKDALGVTWQNLAHKGKITDAQAQQWAQQVQIASNLNNLSTCTLVIEAIVEKLDIKQQLFAQLEALLPEHAVLATNTSSLSVTAIAAKLQRPSQLVGFHFFNPVPLMKVVEVIPGIKTDPAVVRQMCELSRQFGHTPVVAQDTPGFIVNHAGRGYNTEALRIVGEGVADFATVDRILKDQLGFKLGPFELMDLTGLDVSHPVMESIYHQYYQEPRYRPSVITAQRLAGGVLGRKTQDGFYRYTDNKADMPAEPAAPVVAEMPPVWVPARAARRQGRWHSMNKRNRYDALGRSHECFLSNLAGNKKKSTRYYTPRCLVLLIVEMPAPCGGRVLDPCCGSGGMFVQSERFINELDGMEVA